jgi:hypothetical protein
MSNTNPPTDPQDTPAAIQPGENVSQWGKLARLVRGQVSDIRGNAKWDALKFIYNHHIKLSALVLTGWAAMNGVITALIQKFRGVPLDWLIIGMLAVLSVIPLLIVMVLGWRIVKALLHSPAGSALPSDDQAPAELVTGSVITETVPAKNELAVPVDSETIYLNALLCEHAENDEINIQRVVRAFECLLDITRLDHINPTIDFTFTIFNGSVYEISISDTIGGYIKFTNEELYMPKKMESNEAKNISRGSYGHFTIRQVLSDSDVRSISSASNNAVFWFKDLNITIVGAGRWHKKVTPKPLTLNGCITKDGHSNF